METRQYIKDGYNIAVVAKDLWILDYDKREPNNSIPYYRSLNTWVQFTPHGYHVYYRTKYEGSMIITSHKPNTVRHIDMYALIAPSKIDGHSYWWLDDAKGEILTL